MKHVKKSFAMKREFC